MYLVVGWCYSNCRASLQVLNPNVTPITFYNNVIRIENTASTLSAALWLILTFREIKSFLGHFRGDSRLVNYIFLPHFPSSGHSGLFVQRHLRECY